MNSAAPTHDADIDDGADADVDASILASTLLAVAGPGSTGRWFVTYALAFAAVLWGEVARGAFFRFDMIVFVGLAVAAGASVPGGWRLAISTRWLAIPAAVIVVAVLLSAIKNRQLGDIGYALGPLLAAVSMGVVGIAAARADRRLIPTRIVVDVAVYTSLVGVVGTIFHLSRWAELQAQGWRASANFGYANATALFLLIGALAACLCAVSSGAASDSVRCWLMLVGLFATQSRGSIVALALCLSVLWVFRRDAAWILFKASVFALVTFVALIPSIVNITSPAPLPAVLGLAVGLTLVIATSRNLSPAVNRVIAIALGVVGAFIVVVLLTDRVADSGSDQGRVRLWHGAVSRLHSTGAWGVGPRPLASFSRGVVTQLFDHNDVLQYAEYYGIGGAVALGAMAWFSGSALLRTRRAIGSNEFAHALVLVLSVAFVALVDFPFQIPVIPVVTTFVFAAWVGEDQHARPVADDPRQQSREPDTEQGE